MAEAGKKGVKVEWFYAKNLVNMFCKAHRVSLTSSSLEKEV